jgi:hypothetical protein
MFSIGRSGLISVCNILSGTAEDRTVLEQRFWSPASKFSKYKVVS